MLRGLAMDAAAALAAEAGVSDLALAAAAERSGAGFLSRLFTYELGAIHDLTMRLAGCADSAAACSRCSASPAVRTSRARSPAWSGVAPMGIPAPSAARPPTTAWTRRLPPPRRQSPLGMGSTRLREARFGGRSQVPSDLRSFAFICVPPCFSAPLRLCGEPSPPFTRNRRAS